MADTAAKPRMTQDDLLNKVEWEGGIVAAIEYGITSEQVPTEIADRWALVEKVLPMIHDIEEFLYG